MPKRKKKNNKKRQLKRAPVHQLQLDSKENRTISSVIHDDSENDDVTNDSDLFEGIDDNPNNNKKISSLIKLINTMVIHQNLFLI